MKKNFFNKGLALLLCLSMCMGLLQTTALAATYVGGELVCGQTAHTHTDACYADEPQCGQTAHTHDEVCQGGLKYAELVCTIPEGHEHSDDCMVFPTTEEQQLVCKLEEHDHGTAGCTLNSEETWSCNNEHGHIAGCPEGCARVHEHTEDCPEDCTQVHEHIVGCPADCGVIHHTSECTCDVVETWSCGLDNHTHEDACYETVEIPDETQEKVCSLGVKDEDQNHTHGEACYERKTEEGHDCPLQEHEHTAACYFTCAGTEHTHTDACYEANSDGEQAIWDALQNALNSSGDDDIVLIVGGKTITTSGDTGIKVTGNKNLTIANGNGETVGTITANGEEGHRVVTILNGGTVNLIGNVTLTGGNADAGGGGGVFVHGSNSTLNMSAGSISGNTSTASGGGVIVKKGAEFNMYGGTITGNEAQGVNGNGGGVAVNDGTFNMYGGTISDNKTNLDAGDSYEIKQGEKDPMYGRPNSQDRKSVV